MSEGPSVCHSSRGWPDNVLALEMPHDARPRWRDAWAMDAEAHARLILERADYSLYDVPGARALAQRLLGPGSVEKVPARKLWGADGEICRVDTQGKHRIFLSSDLTPTEAAFVTMHELAHWHLGLMAHGGPALEGLCDSIAAALTCPRGAFDSAVNEYGQAWGALSEDFGTSTSCIVLRYGEVRRTALALVSRIVRVRGDENFCWGGDSDHVRRLSKARRMPDGLRREVLPDDRNRVVLISEAA